MLRWIRKKVEIEQGLYYLLLVNTCILIFTAIYRMVGG